MFAIFQHAVFGVSIQKSAQKNFQNEKMYSLGNTNNTT
jgi:hypothetical protein